MRFLSGDLKNDSHNSKAANVDELRESLEMKKVMTKFGNSTNHSISVNKPD